ncbi:rhamnulokinase family protein [Georgenia sp. SYP-B2076]|uniref:rhamnulokinase n=1 Tax=Georgenia sp. SYP-B2076 TaxID=2495881 RepID=UPI000F8E5275|nr:rhamnulokinase family protein [Georgenia sp. SYP-B2076]
MTTFVAVDLGASGGRVILGAADGDGVRATELSRFPNRPVLVPGAGGPRLHWDVLALYAEILDALAEARRRSDDIAGIAIDSWAVDFGLLDQDGALLGNPVHYRDPRTAGVPERVLRQVPAGELYAATGVQVQPFNTVFQLVAAARTAQLGAARRLLLIPDLLGYWLTGEQVAELTNASTTGLLDVRARRWSESVGQRVRDGFGVGVLDLLPPLAEPGTVLGPLRGEVGRAAGGLHAAVVAVGSHDTASAVVAVPATRPDFAYISCGTWSLVGLELDSPVLTEASRAANFTNELGLDGTVRYLRNVMGLWLLQECVRAWQEDGDAVDLAALITEAGRVTPLRRVIDVDDADLLAPGDMPARLARAVARTGAPAPGTRAETVRCILDSLALAYRRAVRQAEGLAGRRVGVVHLVGGGVRNTLLCQLAADAIGLPVVAGPVEGAAMGNLLVQARALGAIDGDLAALRRRVLASAELTRYEPGEGGAGQDRWDEAQRRLWP